MIRLQGQSTIIAKDETVGLVRENCVEYVNGKPVKKAVQSFDIRCNVQPLSGKELLLVPEGDRSKEQYNLWTQAKVELNDRIQRCGVQFQVQTVEAWGSFYECRIMRIDVGPNAR